MSDDHDDGAQAEPLTEEQMFIALLAAIVPVDESKYTRLHIDCQHGTEADYRVAKAIAIIKEVRRQKS